MADQSELRVCESCGEQFGCGANAQSCWCFDIDLRQGKTAEIQKEFSNCLCPTCLDKFAAKPAIIVSYPDGRIETIEGAVRVDTQNYHEGMFDFYDERGNLLRQIWMGSGINWEAVNAGEEN
jgi:hypothetical protein